ncbi:MAG: hypothetical protein LBC79_02555 [Deltaproteobacteria bacterium]|jgi:hypothetical protein|nr:hypothetical protein [Deltaproteobacteria bacterium]
MMHSRYIALVMLVSLVFPAACGSSRSRALQDPVAQSGTGSEELWYQYGGARVAYTAVARPKQLHTGYGAVRDPALYAQAPATTQVVPKARSKPKAKAKPAAAPARDPNCPPCPPAESVQSAPPGLIPQAGSAPSASSQSAARLVPPSVAADAPGATGLAAPLPGPPRTPLPAAAPAPATPAAPAR